MKKFLRFLVPFAVALAQVLVLANACTVVYGETEIPECLKTE